MDVVINSGNWGSPTLVPQMNDQARLSHTYFVSPSDPALNSSSLGPPVFAHVSEVSARLSKWAEGNGVRLLVWSKPVGLLMILRIGRQSAVVPKGGDRDARP